MNASETIHKKLKNRKNIFMMKEVSDIIVGEMLIGKRH